MMTDDPFLLARNLGLLQRQAGVDTEVAELVCAYARLKADAGQPLRFYDDQASRDSLLRQYYDRWLAEKNPNADPRLLSFLAAYSRTMAGRGLPVIMSTAHLANKRGLSENHLLWIAFHQRRFYTEFEIPKSNGGSRRIAAPQGQLLAIQHWILRHILCRGRPHKYANAFIEGRSIVDNVRPHAGRSIVARIDLKDFFPSITHRQVRKVFERFGYPYRVAVLLANLCTLDGVLPQGAPTSPALSNLVCVKMDRRFAGLKNKLKFRYSRYADDLVFSSDNPRFPSLIPFLKEIIREEGLTVNEAKLKIMHPGQRQTVTGLVLNEKPNLPREHLRRLRAIAHRLKTRGPDAIVLRSRYQGTHDSLAVFQGHASFVAMVNPARGRELLDCVPT